VFRGVIPLLQTPFFEDGSLDLASLDREVDYLRAIGIDTAAFPGFVSEWWKLTDAEILACSALISRRIGLIGNVAAQSTYVACEQAREFARLGCVGLMCLPPFVVPSSGVATDRHLRAVLASSPLPHVLQYSASLTGVRFEIAQLKALQAEYPHFRSIKVDFIPPGPAVTDLRGALGDELTILVGFAGLQLADCLARGANGLMGGAGHAAVDLRVYRLLESDPKGAGLRAFHDLLPLLNFEMQTIHQSIATHKWLLKEAGVFTTDHVREPGPHLDAAQVAELQAHLQRLRQD
jgi:dihydrodipicolinate synthase/N-acetylneuraminate lyase